MENAIVQVSSNIHSSVSVEILIFLVDGGWSNWTYGGECSKECGGGFQIWRRSCSEPAPQYKGRMCVGHDFENRPCNVLPCKILEKLNLNKR